MMPSAYLNGILHAYIVWHVSALLLIYMQLGNDGSQLDTDIWLRVCPEYWWNVLLQNEGQSTSFD